MNTNTKSISHLTSCVRCHKFKWMVGDDVIMCNQCKTTLEYMHKKVEDKRAAEKKLADEAKRTYYVNKKLAKRRMRDGDVPKSDGRTGETGLSTARKSVLH